MKNIIAIIILFLSSEKTAAHVDTLVHYHSDSSNHLEINHILVIAALAVGLLLWVFAKSQRANT